MALWVAGCADMRAREMAADELKHGNYEQAVHVLEGALKGRPENAELRSGLVQARTAALTQLLAQAATARTAGQWSEAQSLLTRAQAFDPGGKRARPLLLEMETERRQADALAQAETLVGKNRRSEALRLVLEALKDNPRHPGLASLQRRIEIDQRQAQVRAAQSGLEEQRPISLDFREASLRTVLDVVTRNSGVNFILDRDIRPDVRVTVYLRKARVEDAIDLITSTYQLAKKVIDGKTILIYPNTPEKQREHQEQVVKVFYLANAEAKTAAGFLKSMLRIREPFVDDRSNMLALRDSPENIQLAERLVVLYDSAEPEVLLELEVVEVNTTRLSELGIQLPDSIGFSVRPPAGDTGLTVRNLGSVNGGRIGVTIGDTLINLRRQVSDINTLANPRIRVKNKEKAKVMIGDKVPVVTAVTGINGFVSDSVNYLDVGLKLEVEPSIYPDDEVSIRVSLEVSSLAGQLKTASGTVAYQIGTRNAATLLRLKDGETQLLAGLISSEERSNASRVPGIGDLPVLGRLFSNQLDNKTRNELVLAITPRVLRNIRRPDANETELWVGTDALPRLRPVGGRAEMIDEVPSTVPPPPLAPTGAVPAGHPPTAAAPLPATPQAPTLTWSQPGVLKVGDLVAISLDMKAMTPVLGSPMQINYPKGVFSVVGITEGGFYRQGGAETLFTHSVDASEGTVRLGMVRSDGEAVRGEGNLLTLSLKALKPGSGELSLVSIEPMANGTPVPKPALPVSVTLTAQ